jgi:hypothetical protein
VGYSGSITVYINRQVLYRKKDWEVEYILHELGLDTTKPLYRWYDPKEPNCIVCSGTAIEEPDNAKSIA